MREGSLAIMLAGFVLWGSPLAAQEIPRFNIAASCRHAQALTVEDRNPYEGCMRDEAAGESHLRATWAEFSGEHRQLCVRETQLGDAPSYVEVLTCLQMYGGNTAGSPLPRRLRQRP
jgi:hypothetical protein